MYILNVQSSFKVKDRQVLLESLDGYMLCQNELKSANLCFDGLKRFVSDKPELTWKAALMSRKTMNSWVAIEFFYQAKNLKQFDCKNSDLLLAIKSSYKLSENHSDIIKKAHELAFKRCSHEIPSKLTGVLIASDKYAFHNFCKSFVSKKIIKGVLKKKCLKI